MNPNIFTWNHVTVPPEELGVNNPQSRRYTVWVRHRANMLWEQSAQAVYIGFGQFRITTPELNRVEWQVLKWSVNLCTQ